MEPAPSFELRMFAYRRGSEANLDEYEIVRDREKPTSIGPRKENPNRIRAKGKGRQKQKPWTDSDL